MKPYQTRVKKKAMICKWALENRNSLNITLLLDNQRGGLLFIVMMNMKISNKIKDQNPLKVKKTGRKDGSKT